MKKLLPALLVVLGACSGGGASAPADEGSSDPAAPPSSEAAESQAATAAPSEGSKESAAPDAPGGITLTIGDETWEFAGAQCAYYNAPAGEPGSEWNVSFVQDNNQVYVNVDSLRPYVSITDVVDYGTLQWEAAGDAVTITVNGNDIHAEGTFSDDANNAPSQTGTLDATCASWYAG